MPNLAATLKEEIQRLARKEVKAQTSSTKQAVTQYRREIAKLKRNLQQQQKKIAFLEAQEQKRRGKPQVAEGSEEESSQSARFSPRSVKAQRKRLGLSAKAYGKLVGVAPLTIYNWEQGKNRPQPAQLASLVTIRGIGKREAAAKLELIQAEEEQAETKAAKKAARKAARRAKQ